MRYDRTEVMFMIGELHRMQGLSVDFEEKKFAIKYKETFALVASNAGLETVEALDDVLRSGDAGDLGYLVVVMDELKRKIIEKEAAREQYNPSYWGGR